MLLFVANATKMHGRKRTLRSHRDPTVNYGRKNLDPLPQYLAPRSVGGAMTDRKGRAARQRETRKRRRRGETKRERGKGANGKRARGKGATQRRERGIEATAQGEHEACDEAQRRLAGTAASSGRRRPARRQRGGERRRRATDAGRSLRRLKNRLRFRCAPPRALRMSRSRRRNPSAPPSHAWMRSGRSPSALAKIHRKTYNTASASLDLEPGRLDLPHRRRGGSNPASASRGPCAAPTQKPENL